MEDAEEQDTQEEYEDNHSIRKPAVKRARLLLSLNKKGKDPEAVNGLKTITNTPHQSAVPQTVAKLQLRSRDSPNQCVNKSLNKLQKVLSLIIPGPTQIGPKGII